jgi:uncharacterized protein involved in outer membrane biogenesis
LRDILTVIAGLVILVLAAALVAPPLVDWESRRDVIDRAIARAAGVEAVTEGRIGLRLLPSPRLRVDRLRLGGAEPDAPSLTAEFVKAEISLTPLLKGEVRFLDTSVGRADLRVPVSEDGRWRLPQDRSAGEGQRREWSVENLRIGQLLLTTVAPETGRTRQLFADNVTAEVQKLSGPYRMEGTSGGVPFRLVTGEATADRTLQVKLTGGGDAFPRFDVEGRVAVDRSPDGLATPTVSGKARVLLGPPAQIASAGIPVPVSFDAAFKTGSGALDLEAVTLEAGEGSGALRLQGTGAVRLDEARLALKLEGRRFDVDAFLQTPTGQDLIRRLPELPPQPLPVTADLDLTLNSVALAGEELANLALKGTLAKGRAEVERLELTAPGETRIALSGTLGVATQGGINGRLQVSSGASDRLARYLERLGASGPALDLLNGSPFEASADVILDQPISAVRNLRLKTGTMTLTGQGRYTAPEGGERGRLDAQVGVLGLNLSQLPQISSLFGAARQLDLGFTLDARDVRAGGRSGAGRISARIASDGPALVVETLDVVDVAGANARVSGRIAPDGSGRIAGKVTAQRAAPLVDLLGSVWMGGVSRLVPAFLREGDLDLDVVSERTAPPAGSAELRLRTTVRGRAAGGDFDGEVLTVDGRTQGLDLRVATDNTGRWIDRADAPALRRPSQASLRGARVGSGAFNILVTGDIGGARIATTRPFVLSASDDVFDSGEADIQAADIAPFLTLVGGAGTAQGPMPAEARVTFGRERDASAIAVNGRIAGNAVQARLVARTWSDVGGGVSIDRLSLPWLVSTFALGTAEEPPAAGPWSTSRFGEEARSLLGGQASFRVRQLDLGRGLAANDATFSVSLGGDGLTIRDLDAGLGSGRVNGFFSVTRQGALASVVAEGGVRDVPLASLAGSTPLGGRLTATLRVGASAETPAALIANLGGAGDARITGVQAPGADPAALDRAVKRLLADSDPLANRRAETIAAEELARAPLAAPAIAAPVTLVGGSLRLSPVAVDGGPAVWQGAITYDLKTLTLDARGTLTAKAAPQGWTGALPGVGLAWRGPLANPAREIDAAPLANGLAAIVLQRELDKIEAIEAEQAERQRRAQQQALQRQRDRERQIAEEAARQARLREEQERARAEAERVRAEAEKLQAEQRSRAETERRAAQEADRRTLQDIQMTPSSLPALPPPIDIRPAPQIGVRP